VIDGIEILPAMSLFSQVATLFKSLQDVYDRPRSQPGDFGQLVKGAARIRLKCKQHMRVMGEERPALRHFSLQQSHALYYMKYIS
jgi:hypothetical protein